MILIKSPLRITFGGGGTDLPSFYNEYDGFLISAAINKHIYISLNKPFEDYFFLKYSKYEKDNKIHTQLSGSANQNFHFNCIIGRGESRIPKDTIMIDQGVELHECWLGDDVFHITGFPRIDRAFLRNKGIDIK